MKKTKEEIINDYLKGIDSVEVSKGFIYKAMQEYADQQTKELKDEIERLNTENKMLKNSLLACKEFIKALSQDDESNKELQSLLDLNIAQLKSSKQDVEDLKAEKLQAVGILNNPYTSFRESCYDCIDYLTKLD